MGSLILVDQSWLLHMYYHKYKSMKIVVGNQTYFGGSLYGFTKFISSVFSKYDKDTEMIFCKDGKCLQRRAILPEYKIHRDEKKEVYAPLKEIISVLSYLPNIKFAYHPDYEADDIIAYLAFLNKAKTPDREIIIYSGDQDMWQLIPYGFIVSNERKNKKFVGVTSHKVFAKYLVLPEHLLRYRILIGDRSDGIPPVAPRLIRVCLREFVRVWYETKKYSTALKRYLVEVENSDFTKRQRNTRKSTIKKLNNAQKNVQRNFELMSLTKYKNLEKNKIDVQYIKIQPNLEFVDFYNLHSFKKFLVEFFGRV